MKPNPLKPPLYPKALPATPNAALVAPGAGLAGGKMAPGAVIPVEIGPSEVIPIAPSPQPYEIAPTPADGRLPSTVTVPRSGRLPPAAKLPSYAFSDTIDTPVGATGEELVIERPPPVDATPEPQPNPLL